MVVPERVVDRLLNRMHVDEEGCWISGYSISTHGYCQIGWVESGVRFMKLAHRVSWEAHRGEIPDDMTVDHMCRAKRCINPDHLRLLSNFENARRSRKDWPLGGCVNGHSDEWMRLRRGSGKTFRNCFLCARESRRRSNERARAC